ncbi:core-binding factor subunit beta-like isoform X2 [Branchiostoma lanceolatum]|uniref:core-binding factor subunit beta-like isoform X2 n=1 Tax=Branchiostoma lanceolatum TaxID=7740 RepID=UPI003456557D
MANQVRLLGLEGCYTGSALFISSLCDRMNGQLSSTVVPFVSGIGRREEAILAMPYIMPRVVPDQKAKFENDEFFRKLGRECEIKYTGFRDRSHEERVVRFQADLREGHAEIAFVATGTNLALQFSPSADKAPSKEYVDFEKEPGKVHLQARFILNGVCVRWKGWIDLQRLDGIGSVEFDEEKAKIEEQQMKEAMEQATRRQREFEERQQAHRDQMERRAEEEAEMRRHLHQPSPSASSSD